MNPVYLSRDLQILVNKNKIHTHMQTYLHSCLYSETLDFSDTKQSIQWFSCYTLEAVTIPVF